MRVTWYVPHLFMAYLNHYKSFTISSWMWNWSGLSNWSSLPSKQMPRSLFVRQSMRNQCHLFSLKSRGSVCLSSRPYRQSLWTLWEGGMSGQQRLWYYQSLHSKPMFRSMSHWQCMCSHSSVQGYQSWCILYLSPGYRWRSFGTLFTYTWSHTGNHGWMWNWRRMCFR